MSMSEKSLNEIIKRKLNISSYEPFHTRAEHDLFKQLAVLFASLDPKLNGEARKILIDIMQLCDDYVDNQQKTRRKDDD